MHMLKGTIDRIRKNAYLFKKSTKVKEIFEFRQAISKMLIVQDSHSNQWKLYVQGAAKNLWGLIIGSLIASANSILKQNHKVF